MQASTGLQEANPTERASVLDWIEVAGIENMKGKHETADVLTREAATTLTVLLAGIGASLGYGGVQAIEQGAAPLSGWAAFLVCVWLTWLAWWLVKDCMMVDPIDAIYNEPENLLKHASKPLLDQREMELRRLQARIGSSWHRNERVAKSLNRVRRCAVASPLVFLVGLAIAAAFQMTGGKASTQTSPPSLNSGASAPK